VGPNDAELVRVFTARVVGGAAVPDVTFGLNEDVKIFSEAEAGTTVHGTGAQFLNGIVVRDITQNNNIPFTANSTLTGALASAQWPNFDQRFEFTVAQADLAGRENDVCQVIAFLKIGTNNPDSSFAVSQYFMIEAA
jgi:hypothetical protein